MTLRTADSLLDRIDADLAWRKKELSFLLSQIRNASPKVVMTALRAGITLLYAHWEGFIKTAGANYLEFIAYKRCNLQDLSDTFVALALKKHLDESSQTGKAESRINIVSFIRTGLSGTAKIPFKNVVHTKSNLRAEYFRDIVYLLGLDYKSFELRENLIDKQLVDIRNSIAHGQYLEMKPEEYSALHEEILSMMEKFRNQISNNAITDSHLRIMEPENTNTATPEK